MLHGSEMGAERNFTRMQQSLRAPPSCLFASRNAWHAISHATIAQLGERQSEDLKVPGSIPSLGNA